MSDTTMTHTAAPLLRRVNALLGRLPWEVPALFARLIPASIFWASGQTKVDGWWIADSTWYLFQEDYALPLIPPNVAAVMATFAEHFFPILLVLGFCTRLSALALLGMTTVIEVFVYPDAWPTHGLWAACFLALIAKGPGRLSLDWWLGWDGRRDM